MTGVRAPVAGKVALSDTVPHARYVDGRGVGHWRWWWRWGGAGATTADQCERHGQEELKVAGCVLLKRNAVHAVARNLDVECGDRDVDRW